MSASAEEITVLLARVELDPGAVEQLFRAIESRFHQIAAIQLGQEQSGISIQETVLVDDAFQKLLSRPQRHWDNREQFFGAAARVMRQLLVDHARKKKAKKRGADKNPIRLSEVDEPVDRQADPFQLVAIADVVEKLEKQHPLLFEVFNLHYFMGFELKEIAHTILDAPYTTVKRRWRMAKGFVHRELVGEDSHRD